jgi:hypothetical protein
MREVTINEFMDNLYELVLWPEVQELMEYNWFREECILYNAFGDQLYLDSAYFVPFARLQKIRSESPACLK